MPKGDSGVETPGERPEADGATEAVGVAAAEVPAAEARDVTDGGRGGRPYGWPPTQPLPLVLRCPLAPPAPAECMPTSPGWLPLLRPEPKSTAAAAAALPKGCTGAPGAAAPGPAATGTPPLLCTLYPLYPLKPLCPLVACRLKLPPLA